MYKEGTDSSPGWGARGGSLGEGAWSGALGSGGRSLESWTLPPMAALASGTALSLPVCLRELGVDSCSSPAEQEKEEDRFHSLQRLCADLAPQGEPG